MGFDSLGDPADEPWQEILREPFTSIEVAPGIGRARGQSPGGPPSARSRMGAAAGSLEWTLGETVVATNRRVARFRLTGVPGRRKSGIRSRIQAYSFEPERPRRPFPARARSSIIASRFDRGMVMVHRRHSYRGRLANSRRPSRPWIEPLETRALLSLQAVSTALPSFYGASADGGSFDPSFSGDGQWVAHESNATNLAPGVYNPNQKTCTAQTAQSARRRS